MQWKIIKRTKTCPFGAVFRPKNAKSIHILVNIEPSTNYLKIVSIIKYQREWSKCLYIHYVLEAQYFGRQAVGMSMNFVH